MAKTSLPNSYSLDNITFQPLPTANGFKDITGQTFQHLLVLGYAGKDRVGKWWCKCVCGTICKKDGCKLRMADVESCGCIARAKSAERCKNRSTHGGTRTRIYHIWRGLFARCYNKNMRRYASYGGRGIKICERWHTFENFRADVGEAPDGLSLDRINNDGDYEPSNVRWATWEQQNSNRRNTVKVTYNGKEIALTDFCREHDLPYATTYGRLRSGWSVERAIARARQRVIEAGNKSKGIC